MRFFSLFLLGCASEEAVKVYNSAPSATITSHSSGEDFLSGYSYSFQAQIQDENHSADELVVVWSSDQGILCEEQNPSIDGASVCTASLQEGDTFVRVQVTDPEGEAAIAQIEAEVAPSFAPTVSILSPNAQERYYSDQLLLLSAQIQDAEDASSDLSYQWESTLDGVLATTAVPNEDGQIEEYLYLSEGNHALKLSVTDVSGKSTEKSISFQVGGPNTMPTCSIVSPIMGDSFVVGEPIIFQASASDSEIASENLTVMWTSDKDGELGGGTIDSSGVAILTTSDLSPDTHTIQFAVEDEQESRCSSSVVISVGTSPDLSILSPTAGDVFALGEVIYFSGTVQDGDELPSQVALSWVSSVDGEFSTQGSSASGVLDVYVSTLSAGQHSISVTATDSTGLSDISSLSILVNDPPTAPTLTVTPSVAYTNDDIVAIASGSTDSEGHTISYAYEWFQNNTLTSYTSSTLPSTATIGGDTWMVRVTPNDGYHDGNSVEAVVSVVNTEPQIDSVLLDASEATTSQTVVCTGTASDIDGDTLTESYQWENQTTGVVLGTSASITLSPLSVSPGDTVSCTYGVDDGISSTSSSALISIINTDPSINSLSIAPSNPYIGDTLTCMGSVSDDDLETPIESHQWENQTTGVLLSTTSSLDLDTSNASPSDVIACTLTVTDLSGGTASDTQTVSVGNLPPSIDTLSFDQTTVAIGDTLACVVSASDPEGETPILTYAWENTTTGTALGSGSTLTLNSSMATGLDEISCTATAEDSYGAVASQSISIFVDETIPVFSTVATISPNSGVLINTALTCLGTASDPDGTSVTLAYVWMVGTTTIATGTSLDLLTTSVQPNDVILCTITATDGDGEQATSSTSVTVENSAPEITSVVIDPDPAYTNTDLIAVPSHSDLEGDSVSFTYTWNVNGADIQSGSIDTFASTLFSKNDTISVSVVAEDGQDVSAIVTESIVISNSLSSAPIISIAPSAPLEQVDDISCSIDVVSADTDADPVTYSFAWTVDGTPYTSSSDTATTSTVSAFDLNGGEEWECSVTPNDGQDDGIVATESVVIDGEGVSVGDTNIVVRDGFQYQCQAWSGNECIENWISVPASAFVDEANCGVPDKTTLRPVWYGETDVQCELICWIATGDSTCVGHQSSSGSSGTHTGWMYTSPTSPGCDSSGRAYSEITFPGATYTHVWSFDSMSWSRSGNFSGYVCNW